MLAILADYLDNGTFGFTLSGFRNESVEDIVEEDELGVIFTEEVAYSG